MGIRPYTPPPINIDRSLQAGLDRAKHALPDVLPDSIKASVPHAEWQNPDAWRARCNQLTDTLLDVLTRHMADLDVISRIIEGYRDRSILCTDLIDEIDTHITYPLPDHSMKEWKVTLDYTVTVDLVVNARGPEQLEWVIPEEIVRNIAIEQWCDDLEFYPSHPNGVIRVDARSELSSYHYEQRTA